MKTMFSRRNFLRASTLSGAAFLLLPRARLAFAYEANGKLNVAGIGIGGQGRGDLDNIAGCGANLVGLCDVDQKRVGDIFQKHPQSKPFTDFRRMLDEMEKQIDGVMIATPDHTHAVAAVAAMQRGKHVYCEKPLTHTVHEARVMRLTARKHRVVTQMGNQGSAENGMRRAVELVGNGTIGEVREAYIWFGGGNAPMKRPTDCPPVPESLSWDLWLGPAAERPYNPCYLPASWRAWRAFGSGTLGDMGCHTSNIMFRALQLEQLWNPPAGVKAKRNIIRVEAKPSDVDLEGYPTSMTAVVDLPARGELPPVKLTFSTKERPSEDLLFGHPRGDWGDLLVGSKGSIYSDCPWNTRFVLLPKAQYQSIKAGPPQILPVSIGHHREWVEACKGNGKTYSSFEIGGPLTELLQLVNLATLVEGPVEYDALSGNILNSKPASALLHTKYRKGWVL